MSRRSANGQARVSPFFRRENEQKSCLARRDKISVEGVLAVRRDRNRRSNAARRDCGRSQQTEGRNSSQGHCFRGLRVHERSRPEARSGSSRPEAVRIWRRAAVCALAGGVLWLSGCVEDRNSLTIRQMAVPDNQCVATAGQSTYLTMGTLDVALIDQPDVSTQYFMFPEVENNLLSTEEGEGVELNNIEIIEARVELDFGTVGAALDADTTRFRYPAFITVAPGDAVAVQVLAIPEPTARVMAALLPNPQDKVIVRVNLKFLYQLGEYERETHEVEFPIQVCRNCLIPTLESSVLCDSGLVPDTIREGNRCNIVQDNPVDCCVSGSTLVCPAVDTSSETQTTP